MKQEAFERVHRNEWAEFEALLEGQTDTASPLAFTGRYRTVCRDLALAMDRGFASSLVDRLNDLALRGHQRLYGARAPRKSLVAFFASRFPVAVRAEARLVTAACALFFGVGGITFGLASWHPDLVHSLMAPEQIELFESMYDPDAEHYGTPRGTNGDFAAFAFYTSNNIGVALRTFAWGVFAGIGSLFLLVFNGIQLGVVAAHVTRVGFGVPFFSFVVGHGAFELTAIALAGASGMKLGWSLVAPGPITRQASLRRAASASLPLLYGTVVMLAIAAVIEGFWSASHAVSPSVKFGVGAALWVFVAAWLLLGGTRRSHAH